MGKKEGGRTLNPADKLRKEQRLKENKKNAERRAATRAAILSRKTEDELQAQLESAKRAESEGRADGKQMALRKQIESRLEDLKKEAADKPVKELTLEEQYPDAEGSIYYHPIENPYGVPPPGCLPMWKPGYVLKAQRHLLPRNHPLHPDYNTSQTLSSAEPAPLPSSMMNVTANDDEDDWELDELDGIPMAPEESDSDGDNPPPPAPTTEDDVPGVVYEDEDEFEDFDGADEGYIPIDEDDQESLPPPPKRLAPPVHTNFPPPFPSGSPQVPLFPPFPPPFMPPGMMMMPPHPGNVPFPPPGPFSHPPHQHVDHRGSRDQRDQSRRNERWGRDQRDQQATRGKEAKTAPGEIPDPLDMGPYRKEGTKGGQQAPKVSEASSASSSSSAQGSTGPAPQAPTRSGASSTHENQNFGPMLIPASVRMKRNAPTQTRAVAPKVAASVAPTQPAITGFDQFMSDIKKMGAVD